MSRALLDINVHLALLDSDHIDHARAHAWLDDEIGHGWASCAITENGFVRLISQPRDAMMDWPTASDAAKLAGAARRAFGAPLQGRRTGRGKLTVRSRC